VKLLLSGAHGLLGSALMAAAAAEGASCSHFDRAMAWQLPADQLAELMAGHDWFIHAAANTNVEQCEAQPDQCYRDNWLLTELLVQAARQARVRFLFVSSTGVYGAHGSQPWREYDLVVPTTHHHRSKWMAEQRVMAQGADNLVVRTGWLFGGDRDNPKNFVYRRILEARNEQARSGVVRSNNEQFGSPSYVGDVAVRVLALMRSERAGTFNCVNAGRASRFEYVAAIVRLSGVPVAIEPVAAGTFGRLAQVSHNEMAENWKAGMLGFAPMPDWQLSLEHYIRQLLAAERAP
jgi:dTDP-4-dehydrorhamnose reductase